MFIYPALTLTYALLLCNAWLIGCHRLFHMSDVALFPAVSNLKQKGGYGKGIMKTLC